MKICADRVAELKRREDAQFQRTHAKSLATQDRARRSMPRGVPMSYGHRNHGR